MTRNTVDLGKAREIMLAAGEALKRNMALHMAEKARQFCPVDTGELRDSIAVVDGAATLHSGGVMTSIDAGHTGTAVYVVATAGHALYVELGTMHGHTWRPPNPFMRNAIADTIGAFTEIARMETIYSLKRGGGDWTDIQTANAGSANTFSPLKGPQE